MDYLYHNKTGDVVAAFEDGKVYKDIWKRQLIGSYKNGKIYVSKGLFKKEHIGSYNGDISIVRYGICAFDQKIGYILGNDIYSGDVDKKAKKIAHFYSSDKFGAAAAALLSGMFESSERVKE